MNGPSVHLSVHHRTFTWDVIMTVRISLTRTFIVPVIKIVDRSGSQIKPRLLFLLQVSQLWHLWYNMETSVRRGFFYILLKSHRTVGHLLQICVEHLRRAKISQLSWSKSVVGVKSESLLILIINSPRNDQNVSIK